MSVFDSYCRITSLPTYACKSNWHPPELKHMTRRIQELCAVQAAKYDWLTNAPPLTRGIYANGFLTGLGSNEEQPQEPWWEWKEEGCSLNEHPRGLNPENDREFPGRINLVHSHHIHEELYQRIMKHDRYTEYFGSEPLHPVKEFIQPEKKSSSSCAMPAGEATKKQKTVHADSLEDEEVTSVVPKKVLNFGEVFKVAGEKARARFMNPVTGNSYQDEAFQCCRIHMNFKDICDRVSDERAKENWTKALAAYGGPSETKLYMRYISGEPIAGANVVPKDLRDNEGSVTVVQIRELLGEILELHPWFINIAGAACLLKDKDACGQPTILDTTVQISVGVMGYEDLVDFIDNTEDGFEDLDPEDKIWMIGSSQYDTEGFWDGRNHRHTPASIYVDPQHDSEEGRRNNARLDEAVEFFFETAEKVRSGEWEC